MTDNEIIKAKELIKKLEEAYNDYYNTSKGMPYDLDKTLLETAICLENLIDLINHQNAEIEKLNENIARTVQTAVLEEHALITPVIRYQAIKEFAEAVKMEFYREFDEIIPLIMADRIDNLVEEMTEEHHD